MGLPPEFSLSRLTKSINSVGFVKAECFGGDNISFPFSTKRIAAISSVTFSFGKIPP